MEERGEPRVRKGGRARVKDMSYTRWLETVGEQYKEGKARQTNWLGGEVVCALSIFALYSCG